MEQENRIARYPERRTSIIREVIIIGVALVLTIISIWGFYTKATEVNALRPLLEDFELRASTQLTELDELKARLLELEAKMIQDEEKHKDFVNALRKEIEVLKKLEPINTHPINPTAGKIAYLTFDDGPLTATQEILDVLKEHDVRATFFVNGRDNAYALQMYRRMFNEGHSIGNHTYSHEYDKVYSSVSGFIAEVEQLQDLIQKTTGHTPEVLRFPGGSDNKISLTYSGKDLMPTLVRVARAMGLQHFDWNVTSASASAHASKESIYSHVKSNSAGKETINVLFHESLAVAEALPDIIAELRRQGFVFAPLTKGSPALQFLR